MTDERQLQQERLAGRQSRGCRETRPRRWLPNALAPDDCGQWGIFLFGSLLREKVIPI
ncbi:hypothetical protein JYQ62_08480 [Nostoc sp. UHCC 0702]|nr:hypothetical protein JYQ62_08480 [Nostoc sp. UHCC 0702]